MATFNSAAKRSIKTQKLSYTASVFSSVDDKAGAERDAPSEYGPHKTLYNSWKRWGEMGVFTRIMKGLSAQRAEPQTVMIDATYLKAHRTASSLGVKKGVSGA